MIAVKLSNVPAGAMTLVRTIPPVTLSSAGATPLQSGVLLFSGGSTYTGSLPPLSAATAYMVSDPDSSSTAQPAVVGCFTTR